MAKLGPSTSPDSIDSAFLGRRVANLGLVLAGIGLAFVVMRVVAVIAVGHPEHIYKRSMVVHYLGVAVSIAMWLMCRHGTLIRAACYGIELFGLFACCSFYAVMAAGIPQAFRPEMTILLAFGLFLIAHSVHVPSTWKWTVTLGVALAVPLFVGSYFILTPLDPRIVAASASSTGSVQRTPAAITGIGLATVATWWVVIVATASVASAVIYGLRREVRHAMQLGQYTLQERIGKGGMGVVYLACHAMLRRPTAVKLLAGVEPDERALARFEREVRAASRLAHPNIIPIYDFGRTPDGIFYYAMEYVEGPTLQRLVEKLGPLPPARVIHILTQVCGALAEAHDHGLVHRDVKPANIMLTTSPGAYDRPLVLDFGLVKDQDESDERITRTGVMAGTPHYMPPEVSLRGESDERSDLYSLGCVAYFLLSGKPVFEALTSVAVCAKHARAKPTPPSLKLKQPLPGDLEAVVMRCLEKEPSHRPPSALALREALLGCADADKWKLADARAWWEDNGAAISRMRDKTRQTVSDAHDTLVIDLAERGRHTWE